jgi:hypothetical protein
MEIIAVIAASSIQRMEGDVGERRSPHWPVHSTVVDVGAEQKRT